MLRCIGESKPWWSKSGEILGKAPRACSIPALKSDDGKWAKRPHEKANLLAATFAGKGTLPAREANEYSGFSRRNREIHHLVFPTVETAFAILNALDPSSATGPDELPSRILQMDLSFNVT